MSKDSCHTYIHFHASHHADLFEEFCHPPSSSNNPSSSSANPSSPNRNNHGSNIGATNTGDPSMIQLPGHFLPFEEIQLPHHLMPLNPEDEDDVVPDMHAAFGIQRALHEPGNAVAATAILQGERTGEGSGRGAQREPVWRDLGLERLMDGLDMGGQDSNTVPVGSRTLTGSRRREGRRTGIMSVR